MSYIFTYPDVFNPVDAAGNPRGADMGEAHVLAHELMSAVQMALFDGRIYTTRAALYADLAHAENSWALVIGDPTSGYDGLYRKSGASGAGSWSRVGDVPGSGFIKATDAGAGTTNAIIATSTAIPATDGAALIALNIFETNTASPVTVAFNGGSALTIKTNAGNDVAVGGLTAGMVVAGYVSGSTFRLLSDQASAAIVAAAEAAQAAAEAAAADAAASAAAASGTKPYATRVLAKAADTSTIKTLYLAEAGREGVFNFRAGDFSTHAAADTTEAIYFKADDTAITAGAWVRAIEGDAVLASWGGVVGEAGPTPTVDHAAAINAIMATAVAARESDFPSIRRVILPWGVIGVTDQIFAKSGISLEGTGAGPMFSSATVDDADLLGVHHTRIKAMATWTSGRPVIRFGAAPLAKYPLAGAALRNLVVDAAHLAPYAITAATYQNCQVENCVFLRATSININEDVLIADYSNTATAGGASTITFPAASRSSRDDYYNGLSIEITGGTGSGQTRTISDYVASTGVATVSVAWATAPDATSTFTVTGNGVTEGFNANIHNTWKQNVSWCADGSSTIAWRQIGSPTNNTNKSTYSDMYLVHANGAGFRQQNCDTNTYSNLIAFSKGSGIGVELYGNDVNAVEFARANVFLNMQLSNGFGAGTGGFKAFSGSVTSPDRHMVVNYSLENATPEPIIEDGCEVTFVRTGVGGVVAPGKEYFAHSNTASTAHTGTTAETIFSTGTVNLLDNAMGQNGAYFIEGEAQANSDASSKIFRIRIGTSLGSSTVVHSVDMANNARYRFRVEVRNNASRSAQMIVVHSNTGLGSASTVSTTAINTTTAGLKMMFTGALADTADNMTLRQYRVEMERRL